MYTGQMIFSQLMEFLPKHEFDKCVRRYQGNYRVRKFSCLDQFRCMAFGQLTYRESLRDIETCLRAVQPKLYHVGIRGKVSRSTLADALDSTTIDLCLSLFPWARFRRRKGAVKVHTLMDLRGSIPCFFHVTAGNIHDLNILDELLFEPGSFYIMDRGYIDFGPLYALAQSLAFFVVRAKSNLDYSRRTSRQVDKSTGLRSDQTIILKGPKTSQAYPEPLRHISYLDTDTQKRFVFLTNNFTLPALTIPQLYQCRWRVELFFKWIKQYLPIKAFDGTSQNAVKPRSGLPSAFTCSLPSSRGNSTSTALSARSCKFSASPFSKKSI